MSTATIERPAIRLVPAAVRPCTSSLRSRREALRPDLRYSVADGALFGVMVGCGETYLAAFVLAVGLGEITAGLIASVPLIAGGIVQLITPQAVRRLGSHRRWVVLCAALQAASFLPLAAAAVRGYLSAGTALLIAALYWGSGMSTGPAWNTWIGTLVPRRIRPRYFARRTRISQAAVLGGFLLGGVALQVGTSWGRPLLAFAVLFLLASVCRFLSTCFLARHSEPFGVAASTGVESSWAILKRLSHGTSGRLLRYIIVVQAAVHISGPYFAPYMLNKLHLSYAEYVLLIGTAFMAKIVMLPLFGHYAHRFGANRLLWVGGLGIVPVAGLWLVSNSLPWLLAVQALSGTVWAAYELATFLLLFDSIPEDERTGVLTVYNLANSTALVGGALAGGAVLKALGASESAYLMLFAGSSVLRLFATLLLARIPEIPVASAMIGMRTLAVRPSAGSMDRPILSSLSEGGEAAPARGNAAPVPQTSGAA